MKHCLKRSFATFEMSYEAILGNQDNSINMVRTTLYINDIAKRQNESILGEHMSRCVNLDKKTRDLRGVILPQLNDNQSIDIGVHVH